MKLGLKNINFMEIEIQSHLISIHRLSIHYILNSGLASTSVVYLNKISFLSFSHTFWFSGTIGLKRNPGLLMKRNSYVLFKLRLVVSHTRYQERISQE